MRSGGRSQGLLTIHSPRLPERSRGRGTHRILPDRRVRFVSPKGVDLAPKGISSVFLNKIIARNTETGEVEVVGGSWFQRDSSFLCYRIPRSPVGATTANGAFLCPLFRNRPQIKRRVVYCPRWTLIRTKGQRPRKGAIPYRLPPPVRDVGQVRGVREYLLSSC